MKTLGEIASFQSQTNVDESIKGLNFYSKGIINYVVKTGISDRGDDWSLLGVTLPDGSNDIVLLGHEKFEGLDITECIGKTLNFFQTERGKKATSIEESMSDHPTSDIDKASSEQKDLNSSFNSNETTQDAHHNAIGIYKSELRQDALDKLQDIISKIPSLHMSLLKLMSLTDD